MGYKTCDWCGKTYKPLFSDDRDTAAEFANQMGFGIGLKAIGGIARLAGKKNFCSRECKLAYQQSKNGGIAGNEEVEETEDTVAVNNGSQKSKGGLMSGIGGMFGDVFAATGEQIKDTRNQMIETRAKAEEIVNLQFEAKPEDLQNQLQTLFTQISTLPRFKSPEQKALYNAIKEKLEFGIMKLRTAGASAEADFFQRKYDKLK